MALRCFAVSRAERSADPLAPARTALHRALHAALLKRAGGALFATAAGLGLGAAPGLARADTFTVTKLADTNDGLCDADCSLREAIAEANATGFPDIVDAGNISGTIYLDIAGLGNLQVSGYGDLTINGPVAQRLTISGSDTAPGAASGGIINVSTAGTLTLNNLALVDGRTSESGGALFANPTDLVLDRVTIESSSAGNDGGGFVVIGNVTLANSTVSGNTTGDQGGGFFAFLGNTTVINSTLSGNTANQIGGAFYANRDVDIRSSTISGNVASDSGGGFYMKYDSANGGNSLSVDNSIVANNSAPTSPEFHVEGAVTTSFGFSLVEGSSTPTLVDGVDGNVTGLDPLLGPLQDNGGPTFTHYLPLESPAIDAGDPSFVPPPDYDQRGAPFVRVSGGRLDMGSVEREQIDVIFADGFDSPGPDRRGRPGVTTGTSTISSHGSGASFPVVQGHRRLHDI